MEAHRTEVREELCSFFSVQTLILLLMGKPLWLTTHTRRKGTVEGRHARVLTTMDGPRVVYQRVQRE